MLRPSTQHLCGRPERGPYLAGSSRWEQSFYPYDPNGAHVSLEALRHSEEGSRDEPTGGGKYAGKQTGPL